MILDSIRRHKKIKRERTPSLFNFLRIDRRCYTRYINRFLFTRVDVEQKFYVFMSGT